MLCYVVLCYVCYIYITAVTVMYTPADVPEAEYAHKDHDMHPSMLVQVQQVGLASNEYVDVYHQHSTPAYVGWAVCIHLIHHCQQG